LYNIFCIFDPFHLFLCFYIFFSNLTLDEMTISKKKTMGQFFKPKNLHNMTQIKPFIIIIIMLWTVACFLCQNKWKFSRILGWKIMWQWIRLTVRIEYASDRKKMCKVKMKYEISDERQCGKAFLSLWSDCGELVKCKEFVFVDSCSLFYSLVTLFNAQHLILDCCCN